MDFGVEIKVTKEGLVVPNAGDLRGLGVKENSLLYGAWVAGLTKDPEGRFVPKVPHLAISSIATKYWLTSARLSAQLEDRPGALAGLLKVLETEKVNVHSAAMSFLGYRQSLIEATLELPSPSLDPDTCPDETATWEEKIEYFRKVGKHMLRSAAVLESRIVVQSEKLHKDNQSFLAREPLVKGSCPWYLHGYADIEEMLREDTGFVEEMKRYRDALLSPQIEKESPFGRVCKSSTLRETAGRLAGSRGLWGDAADSWSAYFLYHMHEAHAVRPCACRALMFLAYVALTRVLTLREMVFKCRTVDGGMLLEFQKPKGNETFPAAIRDACKKFPGASVPDLPTAGIMTVATSDEYARVRLLDNNEKNRAFRAVVRYRVEQKKSETNDEKTQAMPAADSSQPAGEPDRLYGFLHALAEFFHSKNQNITCVTSRTTEDDLDGVGGEIEFVVEQRGGANVNIDQLKEALKNAIRVYATRYGNREEQTMEFKLEKPQWEPVEIHRL